MTPNVPWRGAARPLSVETFALAAQRLGIDTAAVRAIWEVEASGEGYRDDGTLQRRFEPHHMPGSSLTWRDSLKIKTAEREHRFAEAYERHPDAALRASSWGGPQIMGFNAEDAGYPDAEAMVRDMAESEDAQVAAFVTLVETWGIATHLRAHDWYNFARRYNGNGQAQVYANKIEAAYRRHSGDASPAVLREGASGSAVKRLQRALGIEADGDFGPFTRAAVEAFQRQAGLKVDGVVGRKTWLALEERRDAKPKKQETRIDRAVKKVVDNGGKVLAGGVATETGRRVIERAPDGAVDLAFYGGVGLALLAGTALVGALVVMWWRDAA